MGDRLQSVFPLPLRAHRHRRLSDHGHDRRRGRRLASVAGQRQPARAADVLDGDVDGSGGCSAATGARRPARREHIRAPAGQGRRDGRPSSRRSAAPPRSCSAGQMPTRASHADSVADSQDLASLYLTHDWNGEVTGLKAFPRDSWPTNLPLVFWAFRIMVGLGLLMIALGTVSLVLRWRGGCTTARWLQRFVVAMGPSGLIAVHRGLDRHRSRPSAVHGVRPVAHGRQRFADRGAGRCRLARRLRGGLLHRLRCRHLVPLPPLPPGTAQRGNGTARRAAGAHRGDHACPGTASDGHQPAEYGR